MCCLLGAHAVAGGFDNSGRPFDIIFGNSTELSVRVNHIYPMLDLQVHRDSGAGRSMPPLQVDDIVSPYTDAMLGFRWPLSKDVNCALQFEQPFRFQTRYPDDALSYQVDMSDVRSQVPAPVDSEYKSRSVTLACRLAVEFIHDAGAFSSSSLSLIAGPKYQSIKGSFSSDLSSFDLGQTDNYHARLTGSEEWAYLLGLAYEIPALAFRVSVFFHNEVEHQLSGDVYAPLPDFSGSLSHPVSAETLTPRAVHFNLQMGIAENWLAFLKLRWGNWSRVDKISLDAGPLSQELLLFSNDSLNYEIGLGLRASERLNLAGRFSSLIELNEPDLPDGLSGTNLRNPQGDRYSLGFGGNYVLTSRLRFGVFASWFYLERGRFSDNAYTVDLDPSHAVVVSGALNYVF
jgi:long-chain fatty acid transport protein